MLNEQQRKTLKLICDTLCSQIGSDSEFVDPIHTNTASQYDTDQHIIRRISVASITEQKQFARFLSTIDTRFVCLILTGRTVPFSQLDQSAREKILQRWSVSRFPAVRRFFQSIKRITLFLSYASPIELVPGKFANNPTWETIGYSGSNQQLHGSHAIPDMCSASEELKDKISCDVLVIGSGAGGAVAAANLAEKGRDVLIVEKGRQFSASEIGNGELEGNRRMFDKMGSLTSRDLSVVILSGSTLGGGTTVNWMTCLDPPNDVRQQWASEFGLEKVLSTEFEDSLLRVRQRLNVNTSESILNRQNQILLDGCQCLGFRSQIIARNSRDCSDCGFCGYGCKSGAKQDTRQTYLHDAVGSGAKVLTECKIERLVMRAGKVESAIATIGTKEQRRPIEIKCNHVVLAGGAIQSAGLLLRSGLQNPNIGRNLHLHPTTAIASIFETPVRAWEGAPQTVLCDEFENLDGRGYGVRLEVAPMHPGFGAMALAWQDSRQHKNLMRQFANLANLIVLTRDRGTGRVSIGDGGGIEVDYRLDPYDAKHLMTGVERSLEIHRASGARTIVGPHQTPIVFQQGNDFEKFVSQVRRTGTSGNLLSLFSAHQMSTCRIGKSPQQAVFDPTGKSFECENLFVADASGLPCSTGVNPMISIMSVSDLLSRQWDL